MALEWGPRHQGGGPRPAPTWPPGWNQLVAQQHTYRSRAEVTAFFDGLDLVSPGVVPVPHWRPDSDMEAKAPTMAWCGVGRKP